ncbi:MAG: hypothetical protein CL840_22055 [Crocinitomicaceae bacterium]|nr:hypothetical protein [Crocinitomicaceae bacterium]|tara:strand:- start:11685 stop:12695 length:1011 start_codon:yes stop_codon:yes gene_type:complete
MQFKWSPYKSQQVYTLTNPVRVDKQNAQSTYPLLVFNPFIEGENENQYWTGTIESMDENSMHEFDSSNNLEVEDPENVAYRSNLQKAIGACLSDEYHKLVVSRKVTVTGSMNYPAVFNELVRNYPDCFVYHFDINGITYMGATPEKLLSVDNGYCCSASLAGTMKLSEGEKIENWGSKERNEQQLVTDYLNEAYSATCENVSVSDVAIKSNGPICHLHSEISGNLKDMTSFWNLLQIIHPTPAVCGLPKFKALDWIVNNEGYDRQYYTGYIGLVQENKAEFYVNLRCLKSEGLQTELYVGGGITKDSVVRDEYDETKQKQEVLLSAIKKIHTFARQ